MRPLHRPNPHWERRHYARVVRSNERENFVQIVQCLFRIDDLHLTAMLGKDCFHFFMRGEASLARRLEAPIDAF